MNHVAVHLKHCKSTMLQLKKEHFCLNKLSQLAHPLISPPTI